MIRIAAIAALGAAMTAPAARGDEVRHTFFAGTLQGAWARSADMCGTSDKSNLAIGVNTYSDSSGTCTIEWIVTRAGEPPYYAVHALCPDPSQQGRTKAVDSIVRLLDDGRISFGRSFGDLATYLRCPAQ